MGMRLASLDRACCFGCLKEVSKSVQVLLNGMEAVSSGTEFNNSEIASPVRALRLQQVVPKRLQGTMPPQLTCNSQRHC